MSSLILFRLFGPTLDTVDEGNSLAVMVEMISWVLPMSRSVGISLIDGAVSGMISVVVNVSVFVRISSVVVVVADADSTVSVVPVTVSVLVVTIS